MPKAKSPKLLINLDLLRPQSSPERIHLKLTRWLISSGRYIFIVVEAVVLIAFIGRFKLDADLASKKEAIEQQIPYIESLKPYEIQIKKTQLKLSTIATHYQSSPDYPQILQKIASQTPQGVKLITVNLEKSLGKVSIQINAASQSNTDLALFLTGLKTDGTFSEISLTSIGLEQGIIRFSVALSAQSLGGTSL